MTNQTLTPTRALVLGGGGPIGIAWQLGVIAGLAESGVDLLQADKVIGTSAGSVVGALLCSGRPPSELYTTFVEVARKGEHADQDIVFVAEDLAPLIQFIMRKPPSGYADTALLIEIGAYALASKTVDEQRFVAGIARLIQPQTAGLDQISSNQTWPARFACTAIDAETGLFRVWDATSGVPLDRAVASSCAVPGLYPPVTIEATRYFDGGMRSPTNADLAAGCDEVVMLAVTVLPFADHMAHAARHEAEQLGERKCRLIVPDQKSLEVFGPNLMDRNRGAEVALVGFEQGQAEAARLRIG
ncbi:patatin-like phospholipase family protein [Lichenihabitans sp. PAMC28606]|uniref:patatin-like phospholipase family protein n=1 Tax=Lichenihabitans sp. PAMC28606 TaxID=2880932 RepID=UPI001D09B5DC|nr:patatin-like phospholipase family protein [Lichenihabitans sp. PAMC28606]UDL96476.1 patatin-like phospholipase family protein [Lichenihabitans sp. PAMC28606]